MKKVFILLLTIFCFYGYNTVKAESEVPELSEEEITEALMIINLGEGIASNLVDLFCNRDLTELVFNGKKYSSIQTLYKKENTTNTQKFIKDPHLNNSSDCDYSKEICNEKSEPYYNHIYEKAFVDSYDGTIWFYSYDLKYNSYNSSIQDFEKQNFNPRILFNINKNKTIYVSNLLSRRGLTQNQFCTLYKESLRTRDYAPKIKNLKIERKIEKEDPIELKGQEFNTLHTRISYNSDYVPSDITQLASPAIQTEDTWVADSGILKGFGVKYQLTRQICEIYTDDITLAGVTKKAECKKVKNLVTSTHMIDYKFTLAE